MTKITENTEEVVEEIVEEVSDNGFEGMNDNDKVLMERMVAKNVEKDEDAETVVEETVDEEIVEEEVVDEPEYLFEVDGKGITLEEAQKGFMRQEDYSRKRTEAAVTEKELQKYGGIIGWLQENPDEVEALMNKALNKAPAEQVQKITANEIAVPTGYENEPAIKLLVAELNKNRAELAEIKGGVKTINQEKTEHQQRTELDTKINNRMLEAYNGLKGQMETPPTPQEFQERLFAHFQGLNLSKADVESYITGPDTTYLSATVDRIFGPDISKTTQAKGADVEKKRKQRVAKTRTLAVAGKSKASAPQSLPKGRDGKIDLQASLLMIEEEKAKVARR